MRYRNTDGILGSKFSLRKGAGPAFVEGSIDPSLVGYAAPLGSQYHRDDGKIYRKTGAANTDWTNTDQLFDLTRDPTGFSDPSAVVQTYDPVARTITLTGTVSAYFRGKPITALVNGWVSTPHTDAPGVYFLYYNGTSFVWSETLWLFENLQIGYVSYGATDKFAIRECHGLMPWASHKEFHETIGTYRESGGDLSGYVTGSTVATNRRPIVSACQINDEDLPTTNATLSSALYTKFYNTGAGVTPTFVVETAEIVPVSGNRPYYNRNNAGTWQQTLMGAGTYMSVWLLAVPVMSDTGSQKYRFIWVQGQTNSGTLSVIQAEKASDQTITGIVALYSEFVFIAQVIIQYVGGGTANWNINSVVRLTGSKLSQTAVPGGQFLTAVTHDETLTGAGTGGSPLGVDTQILAARVAAIASIVD